MNTKSAGLLMVVVGLMVGGFVLLIANFVLDPVPIAAGPAFGLGALGFLFMRANPEKIVIGLATTGAAIGVIIHRGWHLSGQSPAPEESLIQHLAIEGLIGLAAALVALGATGLILRIFEER